MYFVLFESHNLVISFALAAVDYKFRLVFNTKEVGLGWKKHNKNAHALWLYKNFNRK